MNVTKIIIALFILANFIKAQTSEHQFEIQKKGHAYFIEFYDSDKICSMLSDTLVIAEIITNDSLNVLSEIKTNLSNITDVKINGQTAYILDSEQGVFILDITVPNNYNLLSNIKLKELAPDYFDIGMCLELKDTLLLVGSWEYRLNILNVSDLHNPIFTAFIDIPAPVDEFLIKDDLLFITHLSGITIFRISEGNTFEKLSDTYPDDFQFFDIAIYENLAFVSSGGGLRIFDVSNPASLTEVGSFESDYLFIELVLIGNRIYTASLSNGITELNVEEKANIMQTGHLEYGGNAKDIISYGEKLIVADGNFGIISIDPGNVTSISECNSKLNLENYNLSQNYPNPFNPSTVIRYTIQSKVQSERSNPAYRQAGVKRVNLDVFDILGRKVTTIVEKNQSPGSYEVNFDASKLPTGVYYYRLIAGNFTQTKKMVLLR